MLSQTRSPKEIPYTGDSVFILFAMWTGPGYSAGRFPAIEAFELPFMVSDATSGSRALWKFYQQHAQQEFAAYKVLAFHVDGGQAVNTAKREVKTLADWQGM